MTAFIDIIEEEESIGFAPVGLVRNQALFGPRLNGARFMDEAIFEMLGECEENRLGPFRVDEHDVPFVCRHEQVIRKGPGVTIIPGLGDALQVLLHIRPFLLGNARKKTLMFDPAVPR